ncbi:peptidyl-prolyl cis-trans isomerase CYP28, chloroplastic-like [Diospyros lotus]|uniref:peptidyl-prolyl cis-trans isomerase CYP28, chloroplastic-like n=1 Tax=Diospyros lotus TaxID=55363 RepID=UPI0022514CDD|nr:peptidyl-prolyl cis-trans isomerase CYP28, chloroplastic-like [Diospyros lotus]
MKRLETEKIPSLTKLFSLCDSSDPLGLLVLSLYNNLISLTVSNPIAMCTASAPSYKGTLVHKIFPSQFFVTSRQGRCEKVEVKPPLDFLARNTETISPRAFLLDHSRPSILSLCSLESDGDDEIKLNPNYKNVKFFITTEPGPCP